MTDEMKKLLKLMLAEEEENEAGQSRPYLKKTAGKQITESSNKPPKPETIEDYRKADMERARKEMYTPHECVNTEIEEVPLWAKYALTLPEAAEYFHLGYNKLREIVRKDKYAEYLLWNGGRVYIKRKLFEEYLDNKTEV